MKPHQFWRRVRALPILTSVWAGLICSMLVDAVPAVAAIPAPQTTSVLVAQVQTRLSKPAILCGRFDQSKQLAGIKKALASNGRFCVVAGKGVLWRTLQPFPNTLRLTRNEIVQLQGDRVAMRLDATKEPVVAMINDVLFSLLAGDLAQLERLFEIEGSVRDGAWRVTLKARQSALAKALGDITLDGAAYVNHVTLQENASGDRTEISFSALQTGAAAMTAEDKAGLE